MGMHGNLTVTVEVINEGEAATHMVCTDLGSIKTLQGKLATSEARQRPMEGRVKK